MGFNEEKILNHLSLFKEDTLKIPEEGTFNYKGKNLTYRHILPINKKMGNIICSDYQDKIIKYIKSKRIKLHRYFHHLNSSQALCFNLFYPICHENQYSILLKLMNSSDTIENFEFEYIEDAEENTNFDFFLKGKDANYYFEIKYTEQAFGKAENDTRHQKKFEKIYRKNLLKIGIKDQKYFFKHYQILRNFLYAASGHVTFIIPRFRKDLESEINEVKEKTLLKNKIQIIKIENICDAFMQADSNQIKNHYQLFLKKYFI